MSKFRLVSSYLLIAALLVAVAWVGAFAFPLTGSAAIREVAAPLEPQQTSPGYVVNLQPMRYPAEAIQKKIEGTVVIELTFNAAGNIVDSRVISGPEELRQAALESAIRGRYSINVARTLQVLVEFRLANAHVRMEKPLSAAAPTTSTTPAAHRAFIRDRSWKRFTIQGVTETQAANYGGS